MFNEIYVGDFENTTGGNETYVYGGGFMNINDTDVSIFDNIDDSMAYLAKLPQRSVVYFHNFANYDGHIILYWLLTHGYTFTKDNKVRKRFTGIITSDRQIYELKVHFKHTVTFRDTCKLVQGSLDYVGRTLQCPTSKLIGTIDYDKPRGQGYVMDATEREYLKHDVLLLKEIVEKILTMGDLSSFITAGGFAFHEMKLSLYKTIHQLDDKEMEKFKQHPKYKEYLRTQFRCLFPEINEKYDECMRHAYRGGYVYNNSDGEIYTGHGVVLDFNSLYPSVLVNNFYPYGEPRYYNGNRVPQCGDKELEDNLIDDKVVVDYNTPICRCFIVHLKATFKVKENRLPFIQDKCGRFVQTEYIKECMNEPLDFWLCNIDLKLFYEMYDVKYLEVVEGFEFSSYDHFFDEFVNSHYDMKKNAPNKVIRQTAKIILNSAYGKFGTRIIRYSGVPYINDEGSVSLNAVKNTKIVKDDNGVEIEKLAIPDASYIPVAVFCTAYARSKTIRSACLAIDTWGFDCFKYCDTDSLHLADVTLYMAQQLYAIDPVELGYLACESEFDMGRWVRPKTYIERNIIEDGKVLEEPKVIIKACGLTDEGKDMLKAEDDVFMKFTYGLTLKECKLMKHTVVGGCNLHRVDFNIRG